MARFEKKHSHVDLGIPLLLPLVAKKTVILDRETGREAEGLDWASFEEIDRKARAKLEQEC